MSEALKKIAVFVIWLILVTGLATAETGRLTLTLEPSLDGKGDIRATSITDAKLCDFQGICVLNGIAYKAATITNGTAQFNLSDGDAGARLIMINSLEDIIPTRIDDPTKDIHQFVGQKLRVSVIGNLSDPTYRIETFTIGQGYDHPTVSYYDPTNEGVLGIFHGDVYIILSLKTNPQKFQVITLGAPRAGRRMTIIDFTPTAPTHPSTSTSINPSFSKWVFGEGSHGVDYGGNDSKCNTCHGNLDTKPLKFSEITINNGFCFRCHYGKGGSEKGFVVDTIGLGIGTPVATTPPIPITFGKWGSEEKVLMVGDTWEKEGWNLSVKAVDKKAAPGFVLISLSYQGKELEDARIETGKSITYRGRNPDGEEVTLFTVKAINIFVGAGADAVRLELGWTTPYGDVQIVEAPVESEQMTETPVPTPTAQASPEVPGFEVVIGVIGVLAVWWILRLVRWN